MKMNVLVLGLGNILLRDEGMGVRVVRRLADNYRFPPQVTLLDGGTSGMELMGPIADCDCLILVDAVRNGSPPGTLMRFDGSELDPVFRTKLSPHQIALSDVLAALRLTGEHPERVTLFGIEPGTVETGTEPTAAVAEKEGELIAIIVKELEDLGLPPLCSSPPSNSHQTADAVLRKTCTRLWW